MVRKAFTSPTTGEVAKLPKVYLLGNKVGGRAHVLMLFVPASVS